LDRLLGSSEHTLDGLDKVVMLLLSLTLLTISVPTPSIQVELHRSLQTDDAARSEGLDLKDNFIWQSLQDKNKESKILKIDPETGKTIASFKSPTRYPESIVWDGSILWHLDYYSNRFLKGSFDEKDNLKFSKEGTTPEETGFGIALSDKHLIVTGHFSSWLYEVDRQTLKMVSKVQTQLKKIEDIAWDGENVWASEYEGGPYIYRLDLKTGKTLNAFKFTPKGNDKCSTVDGIAYDQNTKLLYVTGKEDCNFIYIFKVSVKEAPTQPKD